jgi:hypothetical protein
VQCTDYCSLYSAASKLGVPLTCRVCSKDGEPTGLLVCNGCGRDGIYHRKCWAEWRDHKIKQSRVWQPCEKTEMSEFLWISWLLDSNITQHKQRELHRKDMWATWFGVPYYQSKPRLFTYPRLQNLLRNGSSSDSLPDAQCPSLISFFGDTGGGKSTLIKALIRNACSEVEDGVEAPVPGNWADLHRSTSGDVHMYSDPATRTSSAPMFYAGTENTLSTS